MNKRFVPTKPYKIVVDDLDNLKYPVIVQPKIDGIRCLIRDGRAISYTLKDIPNRYIRETIESLKMPLDRIVDGELTLLDPEATFQEHSAILYLITIFQPHHKCLT